MSRYKRDHSRGKREDLGRKNPQQIDHGRLFVVFSLNSLTPRLFMFFFIFEIVHTADCLFSWNNSCLFQADVFWSWRQVWLFRQGSSFSRSSAKREIGDLHGYQSRLVDGCYWYSNSLLRIYKNPLAQFNHLKIDCYQLCTWFNFFPGCFKFNFPIVTIYTNLGESGVQYGISQTQAEFILVSQASNFPFLISI